MRIPKTESSPIAASADAPPPDLPDYVLLKRIGQGSYGDVWLARSVMGTFRAIKVIYRDAFGSERPFDREFAGIKRFEPVSQSNENQLKIFHVGQRENYFYYVMELADNAAAEIEKSKSQIPTANGYTPKTLRTEIQQRKRLPILECVEIGIRLTEALAHLHAQGLVHRDIKPSNIIFVNGLTKLADIGLVADTTGTLTFVGTEGYLPPEGPGKAPADIYSLGKVLYEISTGRDRNHFPELPTSWDSDSEQEAFAEFNEVIVKACEADSRDRYQSADDVHADLLLLQRGKSLQQKRSRERRWAKTRKAALGLAVTAGFCALVYSWWAPSPEALRNLPIRLAVDGAEFWRIMFMPRQFDFSPDGERILFSGKNGLSTWEQKTSITRRLELRGIEDWNPAGPLGTIAMPRWAPDSRRFVFQAVKKVGGSDEDPVRAYALILANVDTGEARQIGPDLPESERANDLCWRPDGEAVTYVFSPRRLMTLSLKGERTPWKDSDLPGSRAIKLGAYSLDSAWLLISTDSGGLDDYERRDIWAMPHLGGPGKRLTHSPGLNDYPTWGPNDESVYFVSAGGQRQSETLGIWSIHLDAKTMLPKGAVSEVLVRNGQRFLHPRFVAGGRRLAYAINEPKTDVWLAESAAMESGTRIVRGQDPALSPDGETIYFVGERPEQQGVFAISRRGGMNSLRKITGLKPLVTGFTTSGLSLSPDGQLLALFGYDGKRHGVFVTPTAGGEPRLFEELPRQDASVPAWSPKGNWLAYPAGKQLVRISSDQRVREPLATIDRWQGWSVRWSPDGRHLAALANASAAEDHDTTGVYVVSVTDKTWKKLTPDAENQAKEGLEWHPDGEYLTYMYSGPERFSAQIRRAYLDGRPTDLMIDQPNHWDYIGLWAPDGRRYFFKSISDKGGEKSIHLYDAQTMQITDGSLAGGMDALPRWSRDGRTAVWAVGQTLRYFEVLEVFR